MLGAFCRCGNKRKVDVGRHGAGKLFLCLLGCLLQSLHSHLIIGKIHALRLLKLGKHPLDNLIVEIIAAQMCITVGSQNFYYTIADFNDGDIKGTAAQVVHHNLLLFFIVQTVSKRCRRRLVDNTFYFKTGNLACVLGSLTLCVIKISGNRNDCFGYFLTQIALRIRLQLLKNHSRNLLG